MLKRIFLTNLIILLGAMPVLSDDELVQPLLKEDIGNEIIESEYPASEEVLPNKTTDADFVIQGSVEKNIDMTLDKCLEIALGNNPQINAAFQDILASDARIKQVWSNYFPQLSWQTGYTKIKQLQLSDALGRNLTFNYYLLGQVTLQQMLYDFGVTQNQATIRKLDYEAYKSSLEAIVNDIIYQTKDAYYSLLLAFEGRKVAQDTVDKFNLFYEQAKAFYEIGMNPKVDVTIAETNLSNAKLQLIQADNAVNLAVAKLNNINFLRYADLFSFGIKLEHNKRKVKRYVMKNYYEILEVNQKASGEVIEKAYKVLAKRYHPDLYSGEKHEYAEQKIKDINEAYKILSDEFLREQYDTELQKQLEQEQINRYDRFYNRTNENQKREEVSNNQNKEQIVRKHKVGSFMSMIDLLEMIFKNKPKGNGIKNFKREDWIAAGITLAIVIIVGVALWFIPATNGFVRSLIPW